MRRWRDRNAASFLWDVDGTLVDSESLHEAALVQALRDLGIDPPADLHKHIVGRDAREVHEWCRRNLGVDLDLRDWLRRKYQTYFNSAASLKPRSGAVQMVHRLREGGLAQAIVSNTDHRVVNANLDAVGLSDPGLISISRNDVREGMPGPEPCLRAAWLQQVPPECCLVIEDSVTGARAGVAVGMRTMFWPETEMTPPAGVEHRIDLAHPTAVTMETR